jgi:type IV pilus assembly protein PilA
MMDETGNLKQSERMTISDRGFSMMEMMAVIAVIAILATLAVPSYLERIVRDQIKESLPLADIAKKPIADAWFATQSFPADNAAADARPEKIVANYVSSLTVRDGAIHMTFGNRAGGAISGRVLSLRPAVVEDAPIVPVAWVCGSAEAPDKMKVTGANLTNIKDGLLPLECRAFKRP